MPGNGEEQKKEIKLIFTKESQEIMSKSENSGNTNKPHRQHAEYLDKEYKRKRGLKC